MQQNVTPSFGYDSKELLARIEEMRSNKIWMEENIHKLKKKFANRFIAVYKQKIVGNDSDFKVLIQTLKNKYDDIDLIAIEFIVGEDYYLIL